MYMISVLNHLIHKEVSFPAMKLVWDDQVDRCHFGELPKMTPTHFSSENRMTTEERHALLTRQMSRMSLRKPGNEVIIEPPIIVFQKYQYGETYSFPIVVRNISKHSQKVALLMDESFAFKFDESSQRVAKFPCGMCITATITFTPDCATKDFYHRLIVSSNTTKVSVPIVCIGTRPILNVPDSIVFKDSPVKHWTTKPVTVLNAGKKVANFTVNTLGSFRIKPEKGAIAPNQAFTFEMAYFSNEISSHDGEVCITYDNGEKIFVYLKGNTVNARLKLSVSDIRCEDTFQGLQTRTTFYVENGSDHCAKFYWRQSNVFPHSFQELSDGNENAPQEQSSHHPHLSKEETDASFFCNQNFHIYPLFGEVKPRSKTEIHLVFSPTEWRFYEGTAYLQITGLENMLPFSFYGRGLGPKFRLGCQLLDVGEVALGGAHTYEVPVQNTSEIPGAIQCDGLIGVPSGMGLKVEPYVLEVGAGHYAAFYVNFLCTGKPGDFKDEIKFSVPSTGDTFYVTVQGIITYPSVRFADDEVQLGKLSIGFPKTYHIPLVNESFNYVDTELKMEVDGIGPSFEAKTIIENLRNAIPQEREPQQFRLTPSRCTLRPKALQTVVMTVYPTEVGDISNQLKCWITDMDGNNVETIASIEIFGTVVSPLIEAVVDNWSTKECFLHCPYKGEFIIKNPTELPLLYQLIEQKQTGNLEVTSTDFVGSLQPFEEKPVDFEMVCLSATVLDSFAIYELLGVGSEVRMGHMSIRCEPVPSRVEPSVKNIDFGKIDVLQDQFVSVDIVNTSPMDFTFSSEIIQDDPSDKTAEWELVPSSGNVPPQSKTTLMVRLLLKEVGYHGATINVRLLEPIEQTIEVRMKAQGSGSPLAFAPEIDELLDFGTIFAKSTKVLTYQVTNQGVSPRILEGRLHGEKAPTNTNKPQDTATNKDSASKVPLGKEKTPGKPDVKADLPKTKRQKEKEKKDKGRGSKAKGEKEDSRSAFQMEPSLLYLEAGQTTTLSISASSPVAKTYGEKWTLWSYVPVTKAGKTHHAEAAPAPSNSRNSKSVKPNPQTAPGKSKGKGSSQNQNNPLKPIPTREVHVLAVFETPGLRFSANNVDFLIEATPTQENFVAEESIILENIGTLPIKVHLRAKFPFAFCEKTSDEDFATEGFYEFDTHSKLKFMLQFDGRHLRKEQGKVTFEGQLEAHYDGLEYFDSLNLNAEVRFPEVVIDRSIIDFGIITNGMEGIEQLVVQNTGPFCLTYKWYIKPNSTEVHQNLEPEWCKDLHFDSYNPTIGRKMFAQKGRKSSLTGNGNLAVKSPSQDVFAQALGFAGHGLESSGSNYDEFTQFLEEKMYRNRMLEFMGLKDTEFEAEDEVNYLAFYNQSAMIPKEDFNTNELIDIIPLAGVIEAGKSQTFTAVLYGYPDITFETSLILYIEGGARKTILVKGQTHHPNAMPTEEELPPISPI